MPDGQVELEFWESLIGRVDFAYVAERVIIEVDGRLFHGPDVHESDRERDNAAGLAGWRVLRFTWHMVTKRPDYVLATIAEALRQAHDRVAG
jgi:very-short-patch-repair endonuclease